MIKPTDIKNLRENFYLQFSALLGAAFLLFGKPVPYSNEYSYLLRLRKVYDADFLAKDITFSTPTDEYWLFDHLFGLLTFVFSIEIIGWIGRIACWSILIFVLLKFGRRWEIPLWTITISIFAWLFVGQSIIGDEWMLGDFEAKCVAYICLLFALERFCDEQDISAAILLGLTFAFHPVVGLWGIAATVPALLICRRNIFQTLKISVIAGAFSLIGAIPLLQMRTVSIEPTTENLKYFQLIKFPQHFDPFSWSKSAIILLCFMLIFCIIVHFQTRRTKPLDFLLTFLTILGAFFIFGILFRIFNQYELMKYTSTRLFVVFIPLFFFFYLSRAFQQKLLQKPMMIAALLPIIFLMIWNKVPMTGVEQIKSTYEIRNQTPDDIANAFLWLRNNTPKDSVVIAPPWRYDFWYLSERAEVVNYRKPVIADIGEWQNRIDNLTGKPEFESGIREDAQMAKFYFALKEETINSLAGGYGAHYLISQSDYSYPAVYAKGSIRIYRLATKQ